MAFPNNLKQGKGLTRDEVDLKIKLISDGLNPRQQAAISNCPRPYRLRYARSLVNEKSPTTAIKAKCEECVGWEQVRERVGGCTVSVCPLWPVRPYQNESESEECSDEIPTA